MRSSTARLRTALRLPVALLATELVRGTLPGTALRRSIVPLCYVPPPFSSRSTRKLTCGMSGGAEMPISPPYIGLPTSAPYRASCASKT